MVLLLVMLAVWVYRREHADVKKTNGSDLVVHDPVQGAVKLQDTVDREGYAVVAFIILMGLLVFVTWTALRAKKGDEAMPSTQEADTHSRR